jgi:hypothetical protein
LKASTTAAIQANNDKAVALKAESEAKIQLVNQKKAEELVRESEAALAAAVEDLHAQEAAHQNAINALEAVSRRRG